MMKPIHAKWLLGNIIVMLQRENTKYTIDMHVAFSEIDKYEL